MKLKATIIGIILLTSVRCSDDEALNLNEPEDFYVVDIRNDTDWSFWITDIKGGDYILIKEDINTPKQVLLHIQNYDQDYHIFYKENGYLDKVIIDDFIVSFGNFNGSRLDIGVLSPDGTINVFRDIDSGIDLSKNPFVGGRIKVSDAQIIRYTGLTLKAISCVLSIPSVPTGLGVAMTAWSCGNFLVGLISVIQESQGIVNGFTNFAQAIEKTDNTFDAFAVFDCVGGQFDIDCVMIILALAEAIAGDLENNKSEDIAKLLNEINHKRIVAYNFDLNFIDQSLNQRNGIAKGNAFYQAGSLGRGMAAGFNNTWQIIIDKSTPADFLLAGDWTMAFSINPQNNVDWGNGFIQRIGDNGLCNRRGPIILYNSSVSAIPPICGFHGTDYFDKNGKVDNPIINGILYGTWNRLIFVHRADNTGDIYLNGTKIHSNISMRVADFGTKKMSLGGNYLNDGCYGQDYASNILLDDFALFGKALNATEVSIDKLRSPLGF